MVPPPLLRRIRMTVLGLLVTLVALGWSLVRPAPRAAGPATAHPEHTVPLTDVAPYGANFFLEREPDPWDRAQTAAMADAAGVRWAKQHFLWAYIEPEPGRFEWDSYDAIVDLYRRHDIEVIARLDWPPGWVPKAAWVPESFRDRTNAPPANVDDYARFVGQTVRHFRGRVRFYQIWNEPNLIEEWGFSPAHPVDPKEYTHLLEAAAEAARSADPNVVILSAPLAINVETPELAGNMSDLDYLTGLYEAGAAEWFDVLSVNAFGMDRPPGDPPSRSALNFRRVELQRAIMTRNGDAGTPVWTAEFGWNAAPPDAREQRWRRVAETDQATWTVEGVAWADTYWPWAGVFNVWYFRHCCQTSDRAVYYFRMVDVDWTPRRLYAAVRDATRLTGVAGVGTWGERSAPVRLPRDVAARDLWTWAWADGALDRNALISDEPGATLTLTFAGTSVEARVETGPQAGALLVEVDDQTVPGDTGSPAHSLKDAARRWTWRRLGTVAGNGPHELKLTVGAAGGTVAIDAFRVADGASWGSAPPPVPVVLALLALCLLALLAVDVRRAAERIAT